MLRQALVQGGHEKVHETRDFFQRERLEEDPSKQEPPITSLAHITLSSV